MCMAPKVGDGKIKDPSDEDDKYKDLSVSCNFCSKGGIFLVIVQLIHRRDWFVFLLSIIEFGHNVNLGYFAIFYC